MERTVKCKYCGKPVTGRPAIESSRTYRGVKIGARILGAASAAFAMKPLTAISFITGENEKAIEEVTGYAIGGGVLYHFECKNPDCLQNFDQVVL